MSVESFNVSSELEVQSATDSYRLTDPALISRSQSANSDISDVDISRSIISDMASNSISISSSVFNDLYGTEFDTISDELSSSSDLINDLGRISFTGIARSKFSAEISTQTTMSPIIDPSLSVEDYNSFDITIMPGSENQSGYSLSSSILAVASPSDLYQLPIIIFDTTQTTYILHGPMTFSADDSRYSESRVENTLIESYQASLTNGSTSYANLIHSTSRLDTINLEESLSKSSSLVPGYTISDNSILEYATKESSVTASTIMASSSTNSSESSSSSLPEISTVSFGDYESHLSIKSCLNAYYEYTSLSLSTFLSISNTTNMAFEGNSINGSTVVTIDVMEICKARDEGISQVIEESSSNKKQKLKMNRIISKIEKSDLEIAEILLANNRSSIASLSTNISMVWIRCIHSSNMPGLHFNLSLSKLQESEVSFIIPKEIVKADYNALIAKLPYNRTTGNVHLFIPKVGENKFLNISSLLEVTVMNNSSDVLKIRGPLSINDSTVSKYTYYIKDGLLLSSNIIGEINFLKPIEIIFDFTGQLNDNHDADLICAYWMLNNDTSGEEARWSTEGVVTNRSNRTHIVCETYHLTSFGVLFRVTNITNSSTSVNDHILSTITSLGLSISLAALCATLLMFVCVRALRSVKNWIHANLCVAMICNNAVFLIICSLVRLVLHYSCLATFTWMWVESIYIYRKVVKVFYKKRQRGLYLLLGWGAPVIIVMVTVLVKFDIYFEPYHICWITMKQGLVWSFVGPAIAIICFNFITHILVIKSLISIKAMACKSEFAKIKATVKASIILMPLFGSTWLFGLIYIEDTTIFSYIFVTFNSLQGLLIFLFHCIGDKEVRQEFINAIGGKQQQLQPQARIPRLISQPLIQGLLTIRNVRVKPLSTIPMSSIPNTNEDHSECSGIFAVKMNYL
ncbi:uncharacterized protein TRIADDRAFT_59341 [Trichoplax adhaerens]|uniref:G-protein coupled receptors family 2 profile 2 domain-containing protein n=1 Tax=Trichoplax adhaerens TaxID=10228 RepID=B3S4T7_TRIAD|nr:hypothetical protein TRIADDRAFT_59341 [Trichoplax adhaerens]EDV22143.1 hypothetical protein TRIADDRAFT_59341 [Trichoplax adhaerens]|eukprot:XP_002115298.1 hypothetical protein TRIADDRAFT_59341 [Trichoplax adhaerens]